MRTTRRRMREFADHLVRKYCIVFEHRGSRVILKLHGRDSAVISILRNSTIQLTNDSQVTENMNRFVHLLRFRMATRNDKAIKTTNVHNERMSQCTKYSCFDHLIEAFEDDWKLFNSCSDEDQLSFVAPTISSHAFLNQFARIGGLLLIQKKADLLQDLLKSTQSNNEDVKMLLSKIIDILKKSDSDVQVQAQHVQVQAGTNYELEQIKQLIETNSNKECIMDVMQDFSNRLDEFASPRKSKSATNSTQ